jgi:hypothetical protein
MQVAPVGPPTRTNPLLHWNMICRLFRIFRTYGRYSYRPTLPTKRTFPFSIKPGKGQNTERKEEEVFLTYCIEDEPRITAEIDFFLQIVFPLQLLLIKYQNDGNASI